MSVDLKVASLRAEARIGAVIKDKWRLDQLLGVGGMACVYAATHRNKKRAAVKMLHTEYSNERAIRERFLREGYLANSVGHHGVVTVDDDDIAEDGSAFIVMELLEGETLEQRWRRKGRKLPVLEVLAIADQVLDALAAAHEQGVVHRDLKPDNLFLTRERVVKLLDFGIGRLKQLQPVPTNTVAGAAMGTPAFMAPEQAKGRWDDVDGQTDLWALGATLFTLLTGEYVHDAPTASETLALAVTRPARLVRSVRADLPDAAAAIVDRALAFSKTQRFSDARTMQAAVRRVYTQLSASGGAGSSLLAVTDAELSPRPVTSRAATDPRLLMTTVRPRPPARSGPPPSRRWMLVGGGVSVALLLLLLVRALSSGESVPSAPPSPSSSAPLALALPAALPEPSAAVRTISVEELPEEPPEEAPRVSTPRKKESSVARRR
jgi:serine/threonine-protein kinase